MRPLRGVISDKIRRLFGANSPEIHPGRPASPTKPSKLPPGVEGHKLGGRHHKEK